MKFIKYQHNNINQIGILDESERKVINLEGYSSDMITLIEQFSLNDIKKISNLQQSMNGVPIEEVKILAPIKKPIHDIICVGVNYLDHRAESKNVVGDSSLMQTVYFSKRATIMSGPNDLIDNHFNLDTELDYEVELAIIIGKKGTNIKKEDVEDYIFGYTIFNDFSARSLQRDHLQWYRGKSLDSFSAIGPAIVHKSQLPLPLELMISSKVNGEERQNSNTSLMIADINQLVSEISQGITLEPGDIIATGTPAGVGMGFMPPKYLQSHDTITCMIEGIGVLENKIK